MDGNRLKQLREERGLTQKELSIIMGLKSPSAIGMIERNERNASNELLVRLAGYFDVPSDFLLGISDERRPRKEQLISPEEAAKITSIEDLENLKWIELIGEAKAQGLKPIVLKRIIEVIKETAQNDNAVGRDRG